MIDEIYKDLTNALKSGDKKTADALRMLYSSLKSAKIDKRDDFTDQDATTVIKKEIKKRIESRDIFKANNRAELAAKEEFERALYSQYVPEDISQDKIDEIIIFSADLLEEIKFSTLMPAVMKEVSGRADGRVVSERVRFYLDQQGIS